MARPWLRRGLTALAVLALLALVLAATPYLLLRASLAQLDGTVALVGLGAPVAVERDAAGIPTLRATSRVDLARAAGFVHGQERFFAMDLLRRDAAGELAALFGQAALAHDRERRLHGMRAVAEQALIGLPAAHRAQLEAYAAGVNAGLDALSARPFEYLLLRQAPLPWAAEDTLLAVHAMWFTLTDEAGRRDLTASRLATHLGAALADFLTQPGTPLDAALDGSRLVPVPVPTAAEADLRARLAARDASAGAAVLVAVTGSQAEEARGSNAWAVSGARTEHGAALLANDMHLALRVPNIWYRMRLVLEGGSGLDVSGVSLPGAPAIVAGSNGALAWGFTNAYADVTDRVRLQPLEGDPGRYFTAQGPRPWRWREERIEVAGGETLVVRFRDTVWGPVQESDGELHALRWAAHAPAATNVALMGLEQARSVDDALARVREVGMPAQNLVLADAAGAVAWTIVGRLPLREHDERAGRVLDWREAGDGSWRWLPGALVPTRRGGADGLVWSANARAVGGAGLARIGDGGYALGARASQIRDRLRVLAVADEQAMLDIALDDRALLMQRWHDLLVAVLGGDGVGGEDAAELRRILAGWSGRALPEDVAYRWVREYRDSVHALVLEPVRSVLAESGSGEDGTAALPGLRQLEGVVWTLLGARPQHLLHPRYPDWDALLVDALARTVERVRRSRTGPLAERGWGERNVARLRHPLSRAIPALAWLLDMPVVPLPGDTHVPRVQYGTLGASQRMVVAPGREARGLFHMPAGQSGHPLSPHYGDGHQAWVEGRPTPFLPGPPVHRLDLVPAPGAGGANAP